MMKTEWKIARTMAHLWINDNYSGISVSLANHNLTPAVLSYLRLPPLPRNSKNERRKAR